MNECCANSSHLCQLPTELLICIFKFLTAKNLIVCRQVCRRWKIVIDHVSSDDNLWQQFCEQDFKTLYKEAKMKSISCLWFDIYRSLKLWGRLAEAAEFRDEFGHSTAIVDEIRDISVLNDGFMFVHQYTCLAYYNILTLEEIKRSFCDFIRLVEYDDACIILDNQSHLRIAKQEKQQDSSNGEIQEWQKRMFHNTKFFKTFGRYVYFVDSHENIYYCKIEGKLTATPLNHNYTDRVTTLSFYNEHLHMLSSESNVYIYQNNTFVKLFNLESKKSNIFDCLWQYQFLEAIDWCTFYLMVANFQIHIPDGPFRCVSAIKIYGDTFFVGCINGMFLIYHRPYVNGRLDFFSHIPVKKYSFARLDDISPHSMDLILKVEVVEIKGGHKIFVAMPEKVIVITYTHNFKMVTSEAVMPYAQPQDLSV